MGTPIFAFSDEQSLRRTGIAVRQVLGNRVELPAKPKGPRGGEGDGCEHQNTIWDWTIFGAPTSGTIMARIVVNEVSELLTFSFNNSAADVADIMSTHAEIADTDISVTAGPWPNATMRIEFIGNLKNMLILPPTIAWGSLGGGTGRGVIVNMTQRGH